jgi:hypothetical protein
LEEADETEEQEIRSHGSSSSDKEGEYSSKNEKSLSESSDGDRTKDDSKLGADKSQERRER